MAPAFGEVGVDTLLSRPIVVPGFGRQHRVR